MEPEQQRKKLEKEEQIVRNVLFKSKSLLYGHVRPHWFVQLNYYLCTLLASIALIWHAITFLILLKPGFLKRHKFIDVPAIVERRGSELGFLRDEFFPILKTFSGLGAILWLILIVSLLLLWRGKTYYVYIVIGVIVVYVGVLLSLLGGTYFIEDTTWFDKLTLFVILTLTIVQNFIFHLTQPKVDRSEFPVQE